MLFVFCQKSKKQKWKVAASCNLAHPRRYYVPRQQRDIIRMCPTCTSVSDSSVDHSQSESEGCTSPLIMSHLCHTQTHIQRDWEREREREREVWAGIDRDTQTDWCCVGFSSYCIQLHFCVYHHNSAQWPLGVAGAAIRSQLTPSTTLNSAALRRRWLARQRWVCRQRNILFIFRTRHRHRQTELHTMHRRPTTVTVRLLSTLIIHDLHSNAISTRFVFALRKKKLVKTIK